MTQSSRRSLGGNHFPAAISSGLHAAFAHVLRSTALAAFVIICTASHLSAQSVASSFVRGFSAASDASLRIYVPRGRVQIRTWARDSIHVDGTVSANANFFGSGTTAHRKLGIEPKSARDKELPEADWTITVPAAARVWLKTVEGNIDVRGTTGEIEAYAVTGRIELRDVSGVTSVESIDAPVLVERARGDLRIRGSRGDLTLQDVSGTLSASTVSGSVLLSAITATGRVETIGGAITVRDASLAGQALDLQSHAGTISIFVDPSACPLLNLSSRTGTVDKGGLTGHTRYGTLTARSFRGRIQLRSAP